LLIDCGRISVIDVETGICTIVEFGDLYPGDQFACLGIVLLDFMIALTSFVISEEDVRPVGLSYMPP
jgi:hypothetical protein